MAHTTELSHHLLTENNYLPKHKEGEKMENRNLIRAWETVEKMNEELEIEMRGDVLAIEGDREELEEIASILPKCIEY